MIFILCLLSLILSSSFYMKKTLNRPIASILQDQISSNSLEKISSFMPMLNKPRSIQLPRHRLELPFAIQLMRSSYNMADELDFTPMDEFQKSFFLFRQSEWENYKQNYPNMMQGDLSDPNYFDFISYCQYYIINDKMENGKVEFVEKFDANGTTRIVRRNPEYLDNSILSTVHSKLVGDLLLGYILDTYTTITPKDVGKALNVEEYIHNSQELLDCLVINSYALSANFEEVKPTKENLESKVYILKLKLPVNLWSYQVLMSSKKKLLNDFEIKILSSYASKSSIQLKLLSSRVVNNLELNHIIQLSKKASI